MSILNEFVIFEKKLGFELISESLKIPEKSTILTFIFPQK